MARKRGGLAGFYDRNKGAIRTAAPAAAFLGMAGLRKLLTAGQDDGAGMMEMPPGQPPMDDMTVPDLPPMYPQGTGEAPMMEMAETAPLPSQAMSGAGLGVSPQVMAMQQRMAQGPPRPGPRPAAPRPAPTGPAGQRMMPQQQPRQRGMMDFMPAGPDAMDVMTQGPRPQRVPPPSLIDYLVRQNPRAFGAPPMSQSMRRGGGGFNRNME